MLCRGCVPSQVSFAIGTVKKGVLGGLLSGALFQYPGAILMTLAGTGAAEWLVNPDPWLRGLVAGFSAVGVALVAAAAKSLLTKLCAEWVLAILGTLSAAAAVYWSLAWLFPTLILVGGLVTLITKRKLDLTLKGNDDSVQYLGVSWWMGGLLVLLWAALLVMALVTGARVYDAGGVDGPWQWFEVFYRTGSIIFGGGQVVLPLLQNDVIKYDCSGVTPPAKCPVDPVKTWVTSEQYFAGLGVVQAMPGPLFNFSAYLGAIIAKKFGYNFMVGVVLCWLGLFGPGVLLIFGVLPFWGRFRKLNLYRRALPGLNAAAVGLVLASVFRMTIDVYSISPFPTASLCIGLLAFAAVDQLKLFEPGVVLAGGVLGIIAWAAKME